MFVEIEVQFFTHDKLVLFCFPLFRKEPATSCHHFVFLQSIFISKLPISCIFIQLYFHCRPLSTWKNCTSLSNGPTDNNRELCSTSLVSLNQGVCGRPSLPSSRCQTFFALSLHFSEASASRLLGHFHKRREHVHLAQAISCTLFRLLWLNWWQCIIFIS